MKILAILLFMLAGNGHVAPLIAPVKFDTVEQCKAFLANPMAVNQGIAAGRQKFGPVEGVQAICLPEDRLPQLHQFMIEHNKGREGA